MYWDRRRNSKYRVTRGESTDFFIVGGIAALIYLWLSISVYCERDEIKAEHLKDYQASEQRLSDYHYAVRLKNLGYAVPERFLKTGQEAQNSFSEQKIEEIQSRISMLDNQIHDLVKTMLQKKEEVDVTKDLLDYLPNCVLDATERQDINTTTLLLYLGMYVGAYYKRYQDGVKAIQNCKDILQNKSGREIQPFIMNLMRNCWEEKSIFYCERTFNMLSRLYCEKIQYIEKDIQKQFDTLLEIIYMGYTIGYTSMNASKIN